MKATFVQEPELQFGTGSHVDIRFGLMNYGPLDAGSPIGPARIRLGIVGTPDTIEDLSTWLSACRGGVAAKQSKRPNLFPRFPGFGPDTPLPADIILDSHLNRTLSPAAFEELCSRSRTRETFSAIADLYLREVAYLEDKGVVDVCACAYPDRLIGFLEEAADVSEVDDEHTNRTDVVLPVGAGLDLHDLLKAHAMRFTTPLQIVRPTTYRKRPGRKTSAGSYREARLQDEATRAWNFYVALYYKSGGVPWRLIRDLSAMTTCYIGISFYRALDGSSLLTSSAQVFDERGQGIILMGGPASITKEDRTVHLAAEEAYKLLKNSLVAYRREHGNFPARLIIHKSSRHDAAEIEGFIKAMQECSVDPELADLLSISKSFTRLFRANIYPPLRGTLLHVSNDEFVLYTRGSVSFFEAYPGMYVPRPLRCRLDRSSQTAAFLAEEILGLSKMNWNNTQFDGDQPITIRASRQVGNILKYCDGTSQTSYRYYM